MVWVRIWKISPKNGEFSIFFSLGQKKLLRVGSESTWVKAGLASYLLRVKSKLGSGQGPSLLSINVMSIPDKHDLAHTLTHKTDLPLSINML